MMVIFYWRHLAFIITRKMSFQEVVMLPKNVWVQFLYLLYHIYHGAVKYHTTGKSTFSTPPFFIYHCTDLQISNVKLACKFHFEYVWPKLNMTGHKAQFMQCMKRLKVKACPSKIFNQQSNSFLPTFSININV